MLSARRRWRGGRRGGGRGGRGAFGGTFFSLFFSVSVALLHKSQGDLEDKWQIGLTEKTEGCRALIGGCLMHHDL